MLDPLPSPAVSRKTPFVLTAGLTPAWQRICLFERLRLGEVNRSTEVYPCASGKAVNAGIALHNLGATAFTLAPLGGPTGDLVEADLDRLGIGYRRVDVTRPTRVCSTLVERGGGLPTEVVEDAEPFTEAEVEAFAAAYETAAATADVVILTGSLPQGSHPGLYRDLLAETPCPAILDARGPELLMALASSPLVVKPNRPELARTFGRDLETDEALVAAMQELRDRGARWVVVTDGADPVFVLGDDGRYRMHPPTVAMVNPIASGDCLAAGLAWGLARGKPMLDALRLGVAAASANAAQLLPGRLDPALVESMAGEIRILEGS